MLEVEHRLGITWGAKEQQIISQEYKGEYEKKGQIGKTNLREKKKTRRSKHKYTKEMNRIEMGDERERTGTEFLLEANIPVNSSKSLGEILRY